MFDNSFLRPTHLRAFVTADSLSVATGLYFPPLSLLLHNDTPIPYRESLVLHFNGWIVAVLTSTSPLVLENQHCVMRPGVWSYPHPDARRLAEGTSPTPAPGQLIVCHSLGPLWGRREVRWNRFGVRGHPRWDCGAKVLEMVFYMYLIHDRVPFFIQKQILAFRISV